MPLPSKSAPSADEAAALVFWLIKHGTTSLARVIEHQIRLLRRALLPWLISQYHTLLAVLVSPLWQRFTRKLKQMLDSEIARCCHQILRAWLKHISKSMTAGKELDRPAAAAEESSDQKAFSNVMEDSSSAPGLQQQPSLRTAAEPSAIPASFENIEQQLSTIRHSPVRTADMALITPRSTNKSHSRTDVGWPVSSADDIHDSPLSTPHSRKPFAGNWSSVCLDSLTCLLEGACGM